jgi:hypothetical protein
MNGYHWEPRERGKAIALATVMLGSMLVPLRQNWRPKSEQKDGFPLSYYPMFSAKRRQHVSINYLIGTTADGSRRYLPHSLLGQGGLNQVRRQLNRVVREDRAEDFVKVLAARVPLREDLNDIVKIEIIRGEIDIDQSFLGHTIEGEEEILAEAEIHRLPTSMVTPTEVVEGAEVMPL